MNRFYLATIALFFSTISFAQPARQSFICSYYGEPINAAAVMGHTSSAEAKNVINEILKIVGLQPSFEIRSATIPNAAAIISSGKRYILYNPQFVASIDQAVGNNWPLIAILAHEIGHHLNGHTLMGIGSRPGLELEADEFSGFVLRKMGASLSEAQSALKIAADVRASSTHPAKDDRLTAIAEGWYNAGNATAGKTKVAVPVPAAVSTPGATERTAALSIDERLIAYDVMFSADANNRYYVTKQGNLITFKANGILVIGKLERTGDSQYPFKVSDDRVSLFVATDGTIVTVNGKTVGKMRNHQ